MSRPVSSAALLLAITVAVSAVPSASAQRATPAATPRAMRVPRDSVDRQLHHLLHLADSLARLYGENDDLSAAERRHVGEVLDRTVEEAERLSQETANNAGRMWRMGGNPMSGGHAAEMMSRRLVQSRGAPGSPRGWMGIVIQGAAQEPRVVNGELIIHYLTHPEIVSVEPSSPAERARLVPGDTLLAYDGRDVKDGDISMTRLLRPNARVLVRIRRDGRSRDVPVTIADVPSRISLRRDYVVEMRTTEPGAFIEAPGFARPSTPPQPAMAPMPPMQGATMRRVQATTPVLPVMPSGSPSLMFASEGVAGASLVTVTDGLARTLGVRHGVLVTVAPSGSPAAESGLQDGDVIVKVSGEAVRAVTQMRELVAQAVDNGARSVDVEVVRGGKARKVMLRW